jgi:hypothetical protein
LSVFVLDKRKRPGNAVLREAGSPASRTRPGGCTSPLPVYDPLEGPRRGRCSACPSQARPRQQDHRHCGRRRRGWQQAGEGSLHTVSLAATACAPSPSEASKPAILCEPRCQQARRPGPTLDVSRFVAAALSEWAMPTESTPSIANVSIARCYAWQPALPPRPEERGFQRGRL